MLFLFLLRRFSAWEAPPALRRRGFFVHQGLKKTKGLNGTFFCASSTGGGGQSGQGQGGASGFRHLGEKHGGIGLKIHGHGRVVQNAVVQDLMLSKLAGISVRESV